MRVLLVDDHDSLRAALRELLADFADVTVVGEAGDGADAVAQVHDTDPDLVLMDVQMPVLDGVEATRRILADHPSVRVVALTSFTETESVSAMIAAGASGYLLKTDAPTDLRASVRRALEGRPVMSPEVLEGILEDVAERYRQEQERAEGLAAIDRMKREIVGSVSDQLRNPVTVISGTAQTLQQGWDRLDDATRRDLLTRVDHQCQSLARRIDQILAVVGLEHASEDQRVPLHEVARSALEELSAQAGDRVLEASLAAVEVLGDREVARTVACGLIENAVLHGSGKIEIRTGAQGDEGELVVTDEGPGMAPHEVARLLRPSATDGSNEGGGQDTGRATSSLSTARQLLERFGGRLEVETAPRAGTAVAIRLPRSG